MEFIQENIYHVYNRGNRSHPIFFERENYIFFLNKMRTEITPYCEILAWCLMPNQFHWMIYVNKKNKQIKSDKNDRVLELNNHIAVILRSYTRAINKKYHKTGSLFQQKTKAKNLNTDLISSDNYPLTCFLYIHQNPLRAGLVKELNGYEFSSYLDFAGHRKGSLCNTNLARDLLGLPLDRQSFIELSNKTIDIKILNRVL